MQKIYFFVTSHEVNASGQNRACAKPLPGQVTCDSLSQPDVPLDTNIKMQFDLAGTGIVSRQIDGTIVGVRLTGVNRKECSLRKRTRGDLTFYTPLAGEYKVYVVKTAFDGRANDGNVWSGNISDDEMWDAYLALVNANAGPFDDNSEVHQADSSRGNQQAQTGSSQQDVTTVAANIPMERRIDLRELDSIENHVFGETGQLRVATEKTLIISQIRDRCRVGVSKFSYKKQNGETRIAYGTRNRNVILLIGGRVNDDSNPGNNEPDGGHFSYFDLQRGAWRCFCTEDVMNVTTNYLLTEPEDIQSLFRTLREEVEA